MAESVRLSELSSASFEHMVNALAMNVLGPGHTSFGPGPDAGRDGYFEGEANYPSEVDRWSGIWYIQSKYHAPHLSKDPQKWLLAEIAGELAEFTDPSKRRRWPDNWIVCTNIDPSAVAETGAFDKAKKLVATARPTLRDRFHIWGGKKILDLLHEFPHVRDAYGHFLTPGHVLSQMREWFADERASVEDIIRALVVREFGEQQHTKLEQAGSDADARPGVHKLFIDVPFAEQSGPIADLALSTLHKCSTGVRKQLEGEPQTKAWQSWRCHPSRARVWFLFGGPGQGKSTLGQFFSQIQRAAFILNPDSALTVSEPLKTLATEISEVAISSHYWPKVPRIPIIVELREYSHWLARQPENAPCGVMTYLCKKLSQTIEKEVKVGTLERAFRKGTWFVAFDGLDEVPADNKDAASKHVKHFIDEVAVRTNCDLLCLCTSRPQGYGGQLDSLDCARLQLQHLDPTRAIKCAEPVLSIGRSATDARNYLNILTNAIASPGGVRELMRTPLQCHIMAVVVRDGGKPPERRWQLFNNFYEVIKRREANKELTDRRIEKLLRQHDKLLRSVHNRIGFVLHSMGETSNGATTSMLRTDFHGLARVTVTQMLDDDIEDMVATLCQATEHRLVLVNTPDDGQNLRFDVRQLQEFFAAEFLYESVSIEQLADRLRLIAGDAHWREVMHFLYSALVEGQRFPELAAAVRVLDLKQATILAV
ncbi:MAG: hypothetical protein JNM43_06940 [Planctomycetaceae bacterium]|nr:hypothetical protein [Planctomycetaceae bacterium]